MRTLILFSALFLSLGSFAGCSSVSPKSGEETSIKPEKNDDGEWELVVLDSEFDHFITAIAKPESMYSEQSLKSRNTMLVSEWNSYYYSGRYRNVIESAIEYDPNEKYGKAFEYKLYQVFAYVQWKYGLRLRGLSGADAF